jgi:hypothetical protein
MAATDQPFDLTDGPWRQMIDAASATARKQGAYLLGQNIYPLDPNLGDELAGRPGVRVLPSAILAMPLGSAGRRRVQGIFDYTNPTTGATTTLAVVGGYLYQYEWDDSGLAGDAAWFEVVDAATFLGAAITLSQTAHVAFLVFGNDLFVSDGVNVPWLWDGTFNGGLTKLTNCPVLYGQPAVHEARIFGILKADPTTVVWSEADDATTGYNSGGFNNEWSVTETDPNRLYSITAANEEIYVLRERAATILAGDVTSSFSSTATRDAISSTEGTKSPFAVLMVNDINVLALDADLHPQLYRPGGGGFKPLWPDLRETLRKLPKQYHEKCLGVLYTPADLALLAVPDVGATECNMLLVYDLKGGDPVPVAVWRGWTMTALAMVTNRNRLGGNSNGQKYLLHGDDLGNIYFHGNPEDAGPWDDELVSGTVPIVHYFEGQPLGYSTKREKVFDRLDITVRNLTQMTLEVSLTSPSRRTAAQTVVIAAGVLGLDFVLIDMDWILDSIEDRTTIEAHGDVGVDVQARWAKPTIRHEALGERFGLVALTLSGSSSSIDPESP